MNIEIDRDTLLDPLSNVAGIVERKLSLPILSNILLEGIFKTVLLLLLLNI